MVARVAVIGLGLIGGSMGAALRARGHFTVGFDRAPHHLDIALERDLIDAGAESVAEAVSGADRIVLAVPIAASLELLPLIDRMSGPRALIIDTGSVKTPIVTAMSCLEHAERAIGGHPLAGKAASGPEAADPRLFEGRTFALTPSSQTNEATVRGAVELVHELGARPVQVDAREHDRIVARTSHLPQLMATALALSMRPGDVELTGPGFADMTRLAASDPTLWREILVANGDNVAGAVREYIEQLEHLLAAVQSSDEVGVEKLMREGRDSLLRRGSGVPA